VLTDSPAIDYIRSTQHNERNLTAELQRLQRDSEYGREAHKENEMLKTEVQVMHQALRRLDPNAPHVYGHFTGQLTQATQANGANPGINLPPLNGAGPGPAPHNFGGMPPPPPVAAMQGVEYSYSGR